MRFAEIFQSNERVISFEFFPPKEETALPKTLQLMRELAGCKPDFMTVTYGAGGGTRALSFEMVEFVRRELKLPAVQHLVCAAHSEEEIEALLDNLSARGIENILALRGDSPSGAKSFVPHPSGFFCARDLVRHVRAKSSLSVAVAGYPETHQEAVSRDADLDYLKEKVDAGAELIITQLFFDAELYLRFLEAVRARGIQVPVLPGVMPIANASQVRRFTSLCGATIPPAIARRLEQLESNPEEVIKYGTELAISLTERLLEGGAPGVHLYTLNRIGQVAAIADHLSRVD